jgi:hypothetical protein
MVGVSRHDASLACIATSLAVGALVGSLFSVAMPVALGAGSVPAAGSLGCLEHRLLWRPEVVVQALDIVDSG